MMRDLEEDAEPRDRLTHDFGELCQHGWPIDSCESAGCVPEDES